MAMVSPARYPEFWAGTLDENRRARREVQNLIALLQSGEDCMNPKNCCVDVVVIRRIDPDSGQVQVSYDNGATWQPAPNQVSSLVVVPIPPVTSGVAGTKCDAATNVFTQAGDWIEHVSTAFDVAAGVLDFAILVAAAILDAILLLLSEGALTAAEAQIITIITGVMTGVWEGGKALFVDYWTSEERDKILCAAFCNISDDGSFSDAGFSGFYRQCSADLTGGLAKTLFLGFISSVGKSGLNAMAASGKSADSDCGDCMCFEDCAAEWFIFNDISGHYHGSILEYGDGFIIAESGPATSGNNYLLIRTANEGVCCVVPSLEFQDGTSASLIGWTDCGVAPSEGAPQHTGLFGDDVCIDYLQLQNAGYFKVKITFADCP